MTVPAPSVSILLSNYNGAKFLHTSLSAICSQTRPADEIIIIDDGSTDNSLDIIREFQTKTTTMKVLKNEKNKGLLYSINHILAAATSDYIVWAASDDFLLPTFLEKSLAVLALYPQAGVCFSQLAVFAEDTGEKRIYSPETRGAAFDLGKQPSFLSPPQLYQRLKKSYLWLSTNTALVRREALLEAGGFLPGLQWHADWFAVYAVGMRHGVCMSPETLAFMRETPNSYSREGMYERKKQWHVLRCLIRNVYLSKNKDIYPFFQNCVSLFSPFGLEPIIPMIQMGKICLAAKYILYTFNRLRVYIKKKIVKFSRLVIER